jgi:hypothetical protein
MNLKSFGCSFIFGSELPDAGFGTVSATVSKLTWPSLLAQQLNQEYLCYARPGAGNLQIAERALCHLATNEPSLYVIGWTWIDRFDYFDVNDLYEKKPTGGTPQDEIWWNDTRAQYRQKWNTVMPVDETDISKFYYKNLHSEIRDKLTTLMSIKLVIDTLKQKGYPFIMTYMDDLMFDTRWHTTLAITDIQNYIRPYMTQFDNLNFLDWSKKNNFDIAPGGHPLQQAHAVASKLIYNTYTSTNDAK